MQPLVRSGDLVVLTIDVTTSGADVALGSVFANPTGSPSSGATELRLVDAERRVVHTVAEDAMGACICSRGLLETGFGTTTVQAAFAAPPPDVDALAVMLPHLGVVPDVPVVEGTGPTATPAAGGTATASALDMQAVENASVTALEMYSEQLAGQVRTRADAKTVQVSIDTDVLFAFDSADLSPEAQAVLEAAAGQILESGAGTLSITGHTDDSGSDTYNHELSERRAQAVAQALASRLPADRYPTTVAGRGETEPAVPNTSEDARAMNRRVELMLTTAENADAGSTSPPAAAPLPPPPLAVGRGADGVEVRPESGPGSFRVAAPQARRVGTALVVDLQVTPVSGDGGVIGGLLSTGAVGSRGQFDPWNQYASNGIRLLVGAEAMYPLDYIISTEPDGTPQRTCLCERWLNQDSPVGVTTTATVWVPDPGPDIASVTLEVEGLLRLTDVPVT